MIMTYIRPDEKCELCSHIFRKGDLIRVWNYMPFCNEKCQASYMLMKGWATQKPAEEETKSYYNHCIFKGQSVKVYKRHLFCDFDEFVQYLVEHQVGHLEVVGEQIVAL